MRILITFTNLCKKGGGEIWHLHPTTTDLFLFKLWNSICQPGLHDIQMSLPDNALISYPLTTGTPHSFFPLWPWQHKKNDWWKRTRKQIVFSSHTMSLLIVKRFCFPEKDWSYLPAMTWGQVHTPLYCRQTNTKPSAKPLVKYKQASRPPRISSTNTCLVAWGQLHNTFIILNTLRLTWIISFSKNNAQDNLIFLKLKLL